MTFYNQMLKSDKKERLIWKWEPTLRHLQAQQRPVRSSLDNNLNRQTEADLSPRFPLTIFAQCTRAGSGWPDYVNKNLQETNKENLY